MALLVANVGVVLLVGGAPGGANPTHLQFGLVALTLVGLLLGAQRTEQRDAEKALEEGRDLLEAVLDGTTDAVYVKDADGRYLMINPAGAGMLGREARDVVGKDDAALFEPADAERVMAEDREVLASGRALEFEEHKEARADDVAERTYLTTRGPYRDRNGEVAGVFGVSRDITDRKEAEERLRESEERFRTAFEDAPIGVSLVGLDGRRLSVNRALCEMLGYSEEELLGRDYMEVVHPEDREASSRYLRRLLGAEGDGAGETEEVEDESYALERRYVHADGSVVWNLSGVSLVRDSRGEPGHLVCLHQDITGRKRAEAKLAEAEERYRLLVERAPAVTYAAPLDAPDLAAGYVSPQVREMLGYSPEEWLSDPGFWADHLHPDDREGVLEKARRAREGGAGHPPIEYRMVAKGGREVWVRDEARVAEGPDGSRVLRGVMVDVTERRRAEAAMEESERRFRSVVQNSSEVVKITDADGTLRYASPALRRAFGYDPEAFVGENVLDYVHPEDLPRVLEETREALRRGEASGSAAEYRFRHADGSWRHVESVGTYLTENPAVEGVVVNVRDVTERKKAEETLREAEERYRALVERTPVVTYEEIVSEPEGGSGVVPYLSPQIEGMVGYAPDELDLRHSFWGLLHPDDRERVLSLDERANRTGEPFVAEYRLVHKGGRTVWVRDEAVLVSRGQDGTQLW